MNTKNVPFASHEVRWFFDGAVDLHPALRSWFESSTPVRKKGDFGPPVWMERLDGQGLTCICSCREPTTWGIKWREGNFQIKGRAASLGVHEFCGRFQGSVERWMRWSYAKMPESYHRLFTDGDNKGLLTVSVRKTRALRKLRLDTYNGSAEEVDPKAFIDRGINLELTDLEIGGKSYCTVAFEAYPDDSAMHDAFTRTVETFLDGLVGVDLGAVTRCLTRHGFSAEAGGRDRR